MNFLESQVVSRAPKLDSCFSSTATRRKHDNTASGRRSYHNHTRSTRNVHASVDVAFVDDVINGGGCGLGGEGLAAGLEAVAQAGLAAAGLAAAGLAEAGLAAGGLGGGGGNGLGGGGGEGLGGGGGRGLLMARAIASIRFKDITVLSGILRGQKTRAPRPQSEFVAPRAYEQDRESEKAPCSHSR